jgi:lysophospholipase L1-like esterase
MNEPQLEKRSQWITLSLVMLAPIMAQAEQASSPAARTVGAELFRPRNGLGNFFEKVNAGKEVRVAYLGGSITQADGWRPKTLAWFRKTFPQARFVEIHAAIGGTGSDLGVFRLRSDVLEHKPDLLFVEFAVNDAGQSAERIWRGMEGIVRQTWRCDPTIDICFIYTYENGFENDLGEGRCPPSMSADEQVADHYGIPSINVALRAVQMAREGKLIFTPRANTRIEKEAPAGNDKIVFSNDGVHPHDAGHQIYLEVIAEAMTRMAASPKPGPHALGKSFMAGNWEGARLLPMEPGMFSPGWKQLPNDRGLGGAFHSRMPVIWEATKPGETISFRFKGTLIRLYDLLGPDGAQVICTVDGKASAPLPRFDRYCSYHRIATLEVASGLKDEVHTVRIEIDPKQPDRSIVAESRDNPKKYDGTCLRVGGLLLIGEVVK